MRERTELKSWNNLDKFAHFHGPSLASLEHFYCIGFEQGSQKNRIVVKKGTLVPHRLCRNESEKRPWILGARSSRHYNQAL